MQIHCNYVDIHNKRIFSANVSWENGIITAIEELDIENAALDYLLMGFIDAHVHIESSMLTPCEFARLAVCHGTIAAVSDPHEIANVLGIKGIQFMLDNAKQTPFYCFFGAPSCVPATPFETTGANLEAEHLQPLFENGDVNYLSEMMNFPAVLAKDKAIMAKLALAKNYDCPIDGHAPNVLGEDASHYVKAGISTDHECSHLDEAIHKLQLGMKILIREGSAARNFESLHSLISTHPQQVMLCSDDKHPDDLQAGHINQLVVKAIAHGHNFFDVLRCASLNPIQHYKLPVGQLRVGDPMDALLVDNLQNFKQSKTWIAGQLVADQRKCLLDFSPAITINYFNARPICHSDFDLPGKGSNIRVIKAINGELLTTELSHKPKLNKGLICADIERDILWICVVNRYQSVKPAFGFIQGFGLKTGAIASSVAHDSHNVIAVATDLDSLCVVVNAIIEAQGGIAVTHKKTVNTAAVTQLLALPIAGLMSNHNGNHVAQKYAQLDSMAKQLGSPLRAPFMTLSFMALLVIPELKLSDKGLFDGRSFKFTSIYDDNKHET